MVKNINHKSLNNNLSKKAVNFTKRTIAITAVSFALGASLLSTPVYATSNYAYVPYYSSWGVTEQLRIVDVSVTNKNLGVVMYKDAPKAIKDQIDKKIAYDKINRSNGIIVFNFVDSDEKIPVIDVDSFRIYKKSKASLGRLKTREACINAYVFCSPEGQLWENEDMYRDYVKDKDIYFECSNGSVVASYEEFRRREEFLAFHPEINNPSIGNVTLRKMIYMEYGGDNTIWKDKVILEEYLKWRDDHNYGMKDGKYVGVYGVASTFTEYAKIYNVTYFIGSGLRVEDQFYGANGFLYSSREAAKTSIEKELAFQKIIK